MGRRELVVLSAALGAAIVIGAGTRSLVREGTRGGVASSDPSSSATFEALEPPETSIHLYAPAEDEVMSRITCLTANLAQSLVVKRPEPLGEPTVLVVWNKEKGDLHGQKAQYQRGYVTSLPIVDVAARFYNDFLIVMAKDGSLEIERWLFKDQVGARSGSMPTASVLPGTPVVTPRLPGHRGWRRPMAAAGRTLGR
jgi:hypothetical protein